MKFFDSWTFLIYRSVPQRFFLRPRQKKFDGKSWYSVLLHENFRYPNFSGGLKGLPTQFVSTVRPKKQRKIALPPTEHKIFRSTKNSETERGSTRNIIGSIREKNSTKKNDINLLVTKFFDSWTFLIYRSVPQRNFSARRQKIFDGKSWYSVLLHHFFRYLTFATFRNFRWFLKKVFGTVRQKKSKENRYVHKSCRDPKKPET